MSYLFPQGSELELGVLAVGANIDVNSDSVISIPQNVNTNAAVVFDTINATANLKLAGASVITSIVPSAGNGIALSNVVTSGPNSSFTVTNTGVLELVAGNNISISSNTGVITISATGTGTINTVGITGNYNAQAGDEYIGITTNSTNVLLPTGVTGKTYIVKNESAGNGPLVYASTGQTIDGSVSRAINNNASITVVFRAGQWRIV